MKLIIALAGLALLISAGLLVPVDPERGLSDYTPAPLAQNEGAL